MKRVIFVVLGAVLTILGATGIVIYQVELRRQAEELRVRAAAEEGKVQEEQGQVEELKKQLEEEKRLARESQLKLAEEVKRRVEEEARRRDEAREAARRLAQDKTRRRPSAGEKMEATLESTKKSSSQQEVVREQKPAGRASETKQPASEPRERREPGTVSARFNLDPRRAKEIRVAHVHMGDVVTVRVRRAGGADRKLYVGLAPLDLFADASSRSQGRGVSDEPPLIATPVNDHDEFVISPPRKIDPRFVGNLNSREGAILTIGLDPRTVNRRPHNLYSTPGAGRYELEVVIRPGNNWGIKPRSLL